MVGSNSVQFWEESGPTRPRRQNTRTEYPKAVRMSDVRTGDGGDCRRSWRLIRERRGSDYQGRFKFAVREQNQWATIRFIQSHFPRGTRFTTKAVRSSRCGMDPANFSTAE